MTQLDLEIDEALAGLVSTSAAPGRPFDVQGYINAFRESAREKAQDVLKHLSGDPRFASKKPVFVSIGGGDGEEISFLLENSTGQVGILIEMADQLADVAQKHTLPAGKGLQILAKSAQAAIGEAMEAASSACRSGKAEAIIVTCHAVIHELYDRGNQFDPVDFFGKIFANHDIPTWFTYREPGAPEKWPMVVGISANCSPQSLLALAEAIMSRHPTFQRLLPKPCIAGDGIRVHKDLGMELLSKFFYLRDLSHEINERSTAVNHQDLRNALWTAIGQKAQIEQRANLVSYSAPTKSFISKWEALRVVVNEIRDDHSTTPLGIAESQTRVVAWRLPPQPSQPSVAMGSDIALAYEAFKGADEILLDSLLVSRGRSWIESPDRNQGVELLENVVKTSPPTSIRALWSHYLLSIAELFAGKLGGLSFFEKGDRLDHAGLRNLFRAEQMEFLRKSGEPNRALDIANSLVKDLVAEEDPPLDLDRYALGTAYFLISNFLRFGGRYEQAVVFIDKAESFFKPGIASHATELAHCFYARQVCIAMTGIASFSQPKAEAVQQFAAALIELSYSHAAWFIGRIEPAQAHAERAASRFEKIGTLGYVRRANSVLSLLRIWSALSSGSNPNYNALDGKLSRGVAALMNGDDQEFLLGWFANLRPSTAVGVLQLPKKFSKDFGKNVGVKLPRTLEQQSENVWKWGPGLTVASFSEADQVLRKQIGIPIERTIPLIAD